MGLIMCLVLGAFIGWLTGAIEEVDEGLLARMGVGLLGGLMGNLAAGLLSNDAAMAHITWLGVAFGSIGAFLLLAIARGSASYQSRDQA